MCQSWKINSLEIFKEETRKSIKHVKHLKEKKSLFFNPESQSCFDFKWNLASLFSITYSKRLTCRNASYILILLL